MVEKKKNKLEMFFFKKNNNNHPFIGFELKQLTQLSERVGIS